MKNSPNKATKIYIKKVLRNVPFSLRKKLKRELLLSMNEYLSEIPSPSEQDLLDRFGSPELFAAEYYAQLEPQDYLSIFSTVKRFNLYLILSLIAFAVILTISSVVIINETHKQVGSFYDETIYDNTQSISDN